MLMEALMKEAAKPEYGIQAIVVSAFTEPFLSHTYILTLYTYALRNITTCKHIYCTQKLHAQVPKVAFYTRFGFTAMGDEFDEDGAPHLLMVKSII
jgi:predicted GNAT family N-acyltransferase